MSHVSSTESEVLLAAAPFLINIGLLVVGFGVLKYLAKQEQSHWQSKAKVINTKGGIVPSDYDDGIMYRRLEHTIHTFEAVTIGLIPVLALVLIPSVSGNVSVILWTAIGMFIFGLRYFLYMLTIEVTIDDSLPWRKRGSPGFSGERVIRSSGG
jgi:hypothetical protein